MDEYSVTTMTRYADVLWWALGETVQNGGKKIKRKDVVMVEYDLNSIKFADYVFQKLQSKELYIIPAFCPTNYLDGIVLSHLPNLDYNKITSFDYNESIQKDIDEARNWMETQNSIYGFIPNKQIAEKSNLSKEKTIDAFIRSCFLDKENPVNEWKKILRLGKKIKNWLSSLGIKHLHLVSKKCDLKIHAGEHRRWCGLTGTNIPSYEIFISPDWRKTEGYFYANEHVEHEGEDTCGTKFEFREGSVSNIIFDSGIKPELSKLLLRNPNNSKIGEFALVDNRLSSIVKPLKCINLIENLGGKFGSCHIALGDSYKPSYAGKDEITPELAKKLGFNASYVHMDFVNSEDKVVTAHLKNGNSLVVYKQGQFQLDL